MQLFEDFCGIIFKMAAIYKRPDLVLGSIPALISIEFIDKRGQVSHVSKEVFICQTAVRSMRR